MGTSWTIVPLNLSPLGPAAYFHQANVTQQPPQQSGLIEHHHVQMEKHSNSTMTPFKNNIITASIRRQLTPLLVAFYKT
jgi:hypothetical protein